MGISKFNTGQAIVLDGATLTMHRKLPSGEWQLENQHSGELLNLPAEDLSKALTNGKLKFVSRSHMGPVDPATFRNTTSFRLFDELPSHVQAEAKFRLVFVQALLHAGPVTVGKGHFEPIIAGVMARLETKRKAPSWHSVYRWYTRYMDGGKDILALAPRYQQRGRTKQVHPPEVMEAADTAIDAVYMKPERGTIVETVHRAASYIQNLNKQRLEVDKLPVPTLALIKRAINAIPYVDRLIARFGREYARRKLRNVTGVYIADRPLQYVEIDHTLLDLIVVDDETLLPLGRPYLTVGLDLYTRCVHGVYVGFTPPSILSVLRCLKHGFLPKADLREQYPSVHNEWDCHGVMECLVVDNGLEFHAKDLEAFCDRFGIVIKYCPRKQPWYKPHIERFLGTVNRAVGHMAPGTTFSNIFEKGDYDSMDAAVVTLSTFREILFKWIADVYHQRVHRTLQDTPAHVWKSNPLALEPNLPDDPQELDAMFCRVEQRKLTHKGIELNGLFYNSDDLLALRERYGAEFDVTVRYDDGDLGWIFVDHPGGQKQVRVPAINQAYAAGITLWQHKVFRRYAKRYIEGRQNIEALIEAKREIAELVEKEFKVRRRRRLGKGVARQRTVKGSNSSGAPTSPIPPPVMASEVHSTAIDAPEILASTSAEARQREMWRRRQQAQSAPTT